MSIYRPRPRPLSVARYAASGLLCRLTTALAALVLGALVAGCGGGGDDSRSDYAPPVISWARFQPSSMSSTGGTAYLLAQVADPSGVAWVRATLTSPDGGQSVLEMSYQQAGYYQASFSVPGNLAGDGLQYTARISAADKSGSVSAPVSAGSLTIGGDTGPPPPPAL